MGTVTTVADHGRVRIVSLAREPQLNALCTELIDELKAAISAAERDDRIGCVVLRGAGNRAFCAGADLGEILGAHHEKARLFIDNGHALMNAVSDANLPVIAAVDGWALGGGMELALACHLIIGSTRARFGLPEAKIGCMPGFGGTQRIFGLTSKSFAMRMLLVGDPVHADEAYRHGLLAFEPIAPEDFHARVLEVATAIANGSKTGQERILRAARLAVQPAALEYEAALAAAAISSADGQDGISAFNEKRTPNFHRSPHD
jgi:enoyl-CoA hydratase